MEIVKIIDFWDVLGPVIASIATIVALFGDPFNDSKKGFKRLKPIGVIILVLALLGFLISIRGTYKTNEDNKENISMITGNFNEIKNQNRNLLISDSLSKHLNDSLQKVITNLNDQLIKAMEQELEIARKAKQEYHNHLRDNLKIGISINKDLIESWEDHDLNNYKNVDFFITGKYNYEAMKEALQLPLRFDIKEAIMTTIEFMKDTNDLLKLILSLKAGEKDMNINTLIRLNDLIKENLNWIESRI